MNRKAQLDHPVILFVIIGFGLLLFAPIIMKVFLTTSSSVGSALGNVTGSGTLAKGNFDKVINTAVSFWDKVIVFSFIIAIILMFVSAFLIDVHPFWIFLYIFISFMLVLFTPNIISALDGIYGSSQFTSEVAQLPFTDSIRNNFMVFLVGIIVITGIIIYGKISFGAGGASRR